DFTWTGNTLYTDAELQRVLGLEPGDTYDLEDFQTGTQNIQKLYMDRGYLYFQLQPQEVPAGSTRVNVNFQVQENYQVSVRKINIVGNTKTKEDVIRRELQIFPGDIFSQEKLIRSQREVFILNYFSNIVPDVIPVDDKNVDLQVKVEEKQTDRANASVGYSERDGLLGSVGLEFNNFLGNGQKIGLNYQRGAYLQSFNFSFNEPWPWNRPDPIGFNIFYSERGSGTGDYFLSTGTSYYLPFDYLSRGISLSIGHRFRWPDNYFRGNWSIRDSRDRPEFPTTGSRVTWRTTLSGGPLGGKEEYHKHEFKAEWFSPLPWKFVLYSDVELGAMKGLHPNSVIPYDDLFYMGGEGLVWGTALRGYDEQSVGPISAGGHTIGGRALIKYSLELRFQVSDNPTAYGLAFFESGNTFLDLKHLDPFNLKRSAGVGARLYMPMLGMLGIDIGYGFDPLIAGGQPSGWKTHFVFGQSF
ncbi:MAG: BamA/TamA family outer membrane protein, partial [Calditrichota bacterium]